MRHKQEITEKGFHAVFLIYYTLLQMLNYFCSALKHHSHLTVISILAALEQFNIIQYNSPAITSIFVHFVIVGTVSERC